MPISLPVDDEANELLSRNALALLIAMLLDQQVPLERAFSAPRDLGRRLGHEPTADGLAEFDPEELAAVFARPGPGEESYFFVSGIAATGPDAVSVGAMDNLEAFVSALPKVELHVHMVGSAPAETVLRLARRHPDRGVPVTARELREFYVFRDFPHFIDVYGAVTRLISDPEDIADLIRGVAASLAAQHVRYAEFQFGPYAFQAAGMPDAVITEALDIGARYALAECGVRIGWIIEFPGQRADVHARAALRLALEHPPEALVGFGIGGIEARRAPFTAVIRDVFAGAAAAGLHLVPHAGETTGAETVWEAVNFLRAERIGHGIRSLDDPALVAYLAERQLPVDVSPTSNVCTRCVPSIAEHPLRRMTESGLFVTLNSDDPPMFGTSLSNEYLVAGRDLGFSPAELAGLAANGVRASFLDEAAKEALLAEIAAVPLPSASTALS